MKMTSATVAMLAAALLAMSTGAKAQDKTAPVKIGVLNDQTGIQASLSGPGSVVAAKMAVADFGGTVRGRKVEVIFADHQNKADVGSAKARQWFQDEGVDAIVDVPSSAVALAVVEVARSTNKALLLTSAAASDITGKACSPNTVQWAQDSYAVANGGPPVILKEGGDTWFFITIDYAFGHATERETTDVILAHGGKVLGGVRHPSNLSDFSSLLLQAQQSKAKIIGLASAGDDMANAIKQAQEFGVLAGGQKIAALTPAVFNLVHSVGLEAAKGLLLTESFYWDLNDKSRAFSTRFLKAHGTMPSAIQGDTYAVVLDYLKALDKSGADPADGKAVVQAMRETPGDSFGSPATVRKDGRVVRDLYLFQVKSPQESKGPWDYYKLLRTIPATEATRPLSSDCPLNAQ
jgi:branched-chain amino acid transport system substrate-binding protein